MTQRILLYIGAGWDAYPLTVPALRTAHTHMVYADGIPGSGYAPVSTMADVFANLMQRGGGQYGFAAGDAATFVEAADGSWEAPLKDGCYFKYFPNTLDTQLEQHAGVHALLPHVATLFIAGYYSPRAGTEALLPALERVYVTGCADRDPNSSEHFAVRPRHAGVQYVRIRDYRWNPEHLPDDELFHIYDGPFEEGDLVPAAPFRYWSDPEDGAGVTSTSSDDDEDDSSDGSE